MTSANFHTEVLTYLLFDYLLFDLFSSIYTNKYYNEIIFPVVFCMHSTFTQNQ